MRRHLAIAITAAGLLLTGAAVAQSGEDLSPAPAQGPGADLIAWSEMQSPEPVPPAQEPSATPQASPQPEPRPETPAPQTQAPAQSQPVAAGQAQSETTEPAAQTFTGTIGKDGDNYVLKVSDTTSYKLDDQDQAKTFAGQRVRVLGALDNGSNLIHVQKIESLT